MMTICPILPTWVRQSWIGLVSVLTLIVVHQAQATERVTVGRLRVEFQKIVDTSPGTLSVPIYMASPGDGSGRLFFVEKGFFSSGALQGGRIRVLDNGVWNTFLDLTSELFYQSESGLLGLAFHPGHNDPLSPGYRKVYTYHSVPIDAGATVDFTSNAGTINHHNLVTEWQVDANNPNLIDVGTRREIFREAHVSDIHNSGTITFGPDGYLYGSIGTAPAGTTQQLTGQNNADIMGTIFRIDPIHPSLTSSSSDPISANGEYRIPANNPFLTDPTALDEIFAFGVRNTYRFSVDPETGLVFGGDVGQGAREEINVIPSGGNMGWPYAEGTLNGTVAMPNPPPTLVAPIAEYTHEDGRAVTGGHVYRGSIPELQGKYVFGEFGWGSGAFFNTPGRLLFIEPFDEQGNLQDTTDELLSIEEIIRGESCSSTLTPGLCALDISLLSIDTDDDGELYLMGTRGVSRAIVYKIVDAFYVPEGDYDEDGVVDSNDNEFWYTNFGKTSARLGGGADGNRDGTVDAADYVMWRKLVASGGGANVPEPASAMSLLVAVLALFTGRRWSRRSTDH